MSDQSDSGYDFTESIDWIERNKAQARIIALLDVDEDD